jgi:transcriptional antiterminator NusG
MVFLPTYTSVRIWSDRKKKLTLPLIPSIVFVQSEVSELNNVYKVHGVVSVLKYSGRPAVVRDVEIENLRIVASELNGAYVEQTNAVFAPGESVQVIRGPLQGLYGTSIESEGKHRLIVMIECLDLAYSVSVPRSCVRKIDHQAA